MSGECSNWYREWPIPAVSRATRAGGKGKGVSFRSSFVSKGRGVGGPEVDDNVLGLGRVGLEIGLMLETGTFAALAGSLETPELRVVKIIDLLNRDRPASLLVDFGNQDVSSASDKFGLRCLWRRWRAVRDVTNNPGGCWQDGAGGCRHGQGCDGRCCGGIIGGGNGSLLLRADGCTHAHDGN